MLLLDVDFLSLRFTGNGVSPENTHCKDVAALIRATEEMVEAMAEDSDEDEPSPLCLVAVENESLGLKYVTTHILVALTAWQNIAAVVNTGRYDNISLKARNSLEVILSFVKKRQCELEFRDSRHPEVMAKITPETALPQNLKLTGNTSIIGTVVRVGGNEPKVAVKLATGKTISCESSETIAKELGHRLYEVVTCKGEACWDIESGSIIKFRIEKVGDFHQGSASDAFASLAAAMPRTLNRWSSQGLENVFPKDPEL